MVPGDPERRMRRQRLASGIPVDAGTWRGLVEAGQLVGVEAPSR
jgi:LDH2 family malate/lactate/ureidoglycolate dehydrogenase